MSSSKRLIVFVLGLVLWLMPSTLVARRAITVAEAISDCASPGTACTANADSYASTDTFAIASGEMGVCFIGSSDGDGPEIPTVTWTTGGQAWTQTETVLSASGAARISAFYYTSTHSSSGVTAAFTGGDNQSGVMFHCQLVTGANTTAPIIQDISADQPNTLTPTATFGSSRTADSAVIAGVMTDAPGTACTIAAEGGYTLDTPSAHATPNTDAAAEWVVGGSDTTPSFTFTVCTSAADSVIAAVEIAIASGGGGGTPGCKNGLFLGRLGC